MTVLAYVLLIIGGVNVLVFLFGWIRGRKRHIDALCTAAYVHGYTRGCDDVMRDFRAKEPYAARVFALGEVVRRTEEAARNGWQ